MPNIWMSGQSGTPGVSIDIGPTRLRYRARRTGFDGRVTLCRPPPSSFPSNGYLTGGTGKYVLDSDPHHHCRRHFSFISFSRLATSDL